MVPDEFGHFPEYREVTGTLGELMGFSRREEEAAKVEGVPRKPNPNWVWGRPPFPSLSLPLPFSPTPTREGGMLLPPGVGLPPWARLGGRPSPPPPLLYIRGRGTP